MAQYEEKNKLDYRQGGDTVDDFAQKHMAETTRIFRFLNDLRSLKTNNIEYTEPEPNQLKAEDGKLYVRNATNDAWILLGEIAPNFGFKPADADFISSEELSHEKIAEVNALDVPKTVTTDALPASKIDDVNALDFSKVVTTDNLPQDKIDDVKGIDFDKIVTTDNLTQAKIDDVKAADLPNMVVKQDISIPNEGLVTTEPQKLVRTNNDGVLPVNILGNAARLAGIRVDSDIIQDGQVLTYRAATNTWHNEPKGVIGSGKALNLYDGEELLCAYAGDETRDFDLGITANKQYAEDKANEAKAYADTKSDEAKVYADAKSDEARAYAEEKADEAKQYAIDHVDGKAEKTDVETDIAAAVTEAKAYTDTEKAKYLPLGGKAASATYSDRSYNLYANSNSDHRFDLSWDGSNFLGRVFAPDGSVRPVWVQNANWSGLSGYADTSHGMRSFNQIGSSHGEGFIVRARWNGAHFRLACDEGNQCSVAYADSAGGANIIVQYGDYISKTGGLSVANFTSVTFPQPFPNRCLGVFVVFGANKEAFGPPTGFTNTYFTCSGVAYNKNSVGYIAWGY